jgi:ribosome biogenesis protein MAK21
MFQGKSIAYSGDPLEDFNLMRFLDRFVYKNPKKAVSGQQLLPFICFFVWLC